jgi:hypothetical protein
MTTEPNFIEIDYYDQHFFDCFEPMFKNGAKLHEVIYHTNIENGIFEIIELIFINGNMSFPICLKVNPNFDTIEIHDNFPEVKAGYQPHVPPNIWNDVMESNLVWVWKMKNQQGYTDGIQFEFQKQINIQIMGIGNGLSTRKVVEVVLIQ